MGERVGGNRLVVIQKDELSVYRLDDKKVWSVGRGASNCKPDIALKSPTISRPHGTFENIDGIWVYTDEHSLNGSAYNGSPMTEPGDCKFPEDGDVFVFGGGEKALVNEWTVFALFLCRELSEDYCVEDTSKDEVLVFVGDEEERKFVRPEKGTVADFGTGIGIYMGERTYLLGNVSLKRG